MSWAHDNPPGVDHCEKCHASFKHEDIPLAGIKNAIGPSLSEDMVGILPLAETITVPEETSLEAAIGNMPEQMIRCLLVTDRENQLLALTPST